MKTCADCKQEKPLDQFGLISTRKDGRNPYCRKCKTLRTKAWQQKNPEKVTEWRRNKTLKGYGLTTETYDAMLAAQGGTCALCKRVPKIFNIDHCHTTGKVRGILCPSCNKALGLLQDDIEVLKRAVEYLVP